MLKIRGEKGLTGLIMAAGLLIAFAALSISIHGIYVMVSTSQFGDTEVPKPITGKFESGVLKGVAYKLEKSQYHPKIELELRLQNELIVVYYYIPTEHRALSGWRSFYGKLRPEVEAQLVQSFSSYTTEFEYEYKQKNAFRDLINYRRGDEDSGE